MIWQFTHRDCEVLLAELRLRVLSTKAGPSVPRPQSHLWAGRRKLRQKRLGESVSSERLHAAKAHDRLAPARGATFATGRSAAAARHSAAARPSVDRNAALCPGSGGKTGPAATHNAKRATAPAAARRLHLGQEQEGAEEERRSPAVAPSHTRARNEPGNRVMPAND
jgi:hypothetical protein